MKNNTPTIPATYSPPSYVTVFTLTGLLCLIVGIILVYEAFEASQPPAVGIALIFMAFAEIVYAQIANDVGRAAWQTARTAQELAPALKELAAQAADRAKRDAASDAEARRVLEERTLVR